MHHPHLLAVLALSLSSIACASADAAPPPPAVPWLSFALTRTAADLAAAGPDATEFHAFTPEAPAGYAIEESHIFTPQRPHFQPSHPLAAESMVVVDAEDDGGYVIGSYTVDDVHGFEGHRGAPASFLTHGMAGAGPLGCAFRVRSVAVGGGPGAPFAALVTSGPYEATGFTVSITLRPPAYVIAVPVP